MILLGLHIGCIKPRPTAPENPTAATTPSEAAMEDALILSLREALDVYSADMFAKNGKAALPSNPFDALEKAPVGYLSSGGDADTSGAWTYNTETQRITHQRSDGSRYFWTYDAGVGDAEDLPAFEPPWNDGQSTNWTDWCAFELREGCYACENTEGAGKYCVENCAQAACPGFTASAGDDDATGGAIGSRQPF